MGAAVTDAMSRQAPEGSSGSTSTCSWGRWHRGPTAGGDRAGARGARCGRRHSGDGFGYFLEQSTRPQTIGYGLLDSPVALAAWMLDHDTDSYYKIARAFVDGRPRATSPATTSSTTSRCTG